MNNQIKITLPPMAEGQTDWKLYTEYQSPIGRDPWPWHHRVIWQVLMWFHARAERTWHWLWDIAQPFQQPPMKYETKYHEIKVLKQDGLFLTVDSTEHLTAGSKLFQKKPDV
jgi:hypothetical protein